MLLDPGCVSVGGGAAIFALRPSCDNAIVH